MNRRYIAAAIVAFASLGFLSVASAGNAKLEQALQIGSHAKSSIPAASQKQPSSVYIIQFRGDPLMSYSGDTQGMAATQPAKGDRLQAHSKESKAYRNFLKGKQNTVLSQCGVSANNLVYSYTNSFNGVAARMTTAQVAEARAHGDVLNVWKDEIRQMQTDSTRGFLGLTNRRNGLWRQGIVGEDVIVGVLDSGIYPEHPSFADEPTRKKGNRGRKIPYGPAPAGWSGTECDFGNTAFNADDAPFTCNNKVLGASSYSAGFLNGADPAVRLTPQSSLSARDDDGHGSATAQNATGNFGVQAVIAGEEVGARKTSGVAPRARVAAYKVCWNGPQPGTVDDGCANSDSMAAIDQAVADGVDVINFSVGGASTSFGAPDAIAFLNAAAAGVHVASSAGNSGSLNGTVGAPAIAPWITSVAAVNDNQNFALGVDVTAPVGVVGLKAGVEGAGSVLLADVGPITGDVVASIPADGCTPLTNAGDIAGNIALVIRGACAFDTKYAEAEAAGAVAIIVYNDGTAADRINPFVMGGIDPSRAIPGVMIGSADGAALAAETSVVATLDVNNQVSLKNSIAGFSSRGPNNGALDIIKPDIAAPGVNILSAETPFEGLDAGPGGEEFQFISGTSFSSPHVAGVMALLKQAHPDWSPAAMRSAIMTTARQNLVTEFDNEPADPFDFGAGHVVANKAVDPGLVYDAGILDYAAFTCANNVALFDQATCDLLVAAGFPTDGSDLNLPSIGIGELIGSQTVTRTVTNVANNRGRAKYRVSVEAPAGIDVVVSPTVLRLRSGESAQYTVTFTTNGDAVFDEFAFGSLTWKEVNRSRRGSRGHHGYYGYGSRGSKGSKGSGGNSGTRHIVRSPIAVQPVRFSSTNEADVVSGADGSAVVDVKFGYDGDYTANFTGLSEGLPLAGNVSAVEGLDLFCFDLPAHTHFRMAMFDEDTSAPGLDDLDLRLFAVDNCTDFNILGQIGGSGNSASDEVIDIADPAAGGYATVIDYFSSANGTDSDYVLWVYAVFDTDAEGGPPTVTAPTSASVGSTGTVTVDYTGLTVPSRYLGIVSHQDAGGEIDRSIVDIETQ